METQTINDYIKEYFRYHGFANTIECFESELRSKASSSLKESKKGGAEPRMHGLFRGKTTGSGGKSVQVLENELQEVSKKYNQIIQAARQIFSVSINVLQQLYSAKEVTKNEGLMETIESYKIQLGKYHKIVVNEGKPEGNELITETVMKEHKTKLMKNYSEKNVDGMIEVLLSLRVNALQIAPELRKNLVYELVRNDIMNIESTGGFSFLINILDIPNNSLKHAITSLISVIASTLRGVEYLTTRGNPVIIEKIIKIMKEQENGSVTQRFCIATLQKCSIKDTLIPTYVSEGLIQWVIELLNKSLSSKIHVFCLDFASAFFANIVHTPSTTTYFEENPEFTYNVMESLLKFIRENIPVSVLMHVLIALSYMSKENFQAHIEKTNFVDRISEFVVIYSQINTADNEALEIDKKTVLDLCAHMFHPKDTSLGDSASMEYNELKTEDRIREYENEQGELIFECFQDEVS